MISVIYASLSAFLICWLSLHVIKLRHKNKVSIGDNGIDDLKIAMSTQSNAIEYIPIALIMLFGLEYNQANIWIIHAFGIALLTGRLTHARSMLKNDLKGRVLGMQITIFTLIGLGAANLIFLPYGKFF